MKQKYNPVNWIVVLLMIIIETLVTLLFLPFLILKGINPFTDLFDEVKEFIDELLNE